LICEQIYVSKPSNQLFFMDEIDPDRPQSFDLKFENKLILDTILNQCPSCDLHLRGTGPIVISADVKFRTLAIETSNELVMSSGGSLRAVNITIRAESVSMSGGAIIKASGMLVEKSNLNADVTYDSSASQFYGAGGGHSAGFGIRPVSTATVPGFRTIDPDEFRFPTMPGLVGGTTNPPKALATISGPALGGKPGGVIRMIVAGVLSIDDDSTIDASGTEPQVSTALACVDPGEYDEACKVRVPYVALVGGGGGGGGSIWIDALSVIGGGLISANGGSVHSAVPGSSVASPGGAGGGGFVAVHFFDQLSVSLLAHGGRSQEFTAFGTAGFVYTKRTATGAEELTLDNSLDKQQSSWPATTLPVGPIGALTIKTGAIARLANDKLVVAHLTMHHNAQLRGSANGDMLRVRSETVNISDASRVFAGIIEITALAINVSGRLTEISAAGTSSGSGASGQTSAIAMGGAGGGGSPAAKGGACAGFFGGSLSIDSRGGEGGSAFTGRTPPIAGGLGGGIVRLNAHSALTFTNNPIITVAGGPGVSPGSGGGGGGTIELIADAFSGTATLNATGGSASGLGGGGAGGLIVFRGPVQQLLSFPTSLGGGRNLLNPGCDGDIGTVMQLSILTQNRERFACHAGSYDDLKSPVCMACLAGTSTIVPGATSCDRMVCIDAGTVANSSTSGCVPCAPGTYRVVFDNGGRCEPCPVGSEAPYPATQVCLPCKRGSTAPNPGTVRCTVTAAVASVDNTNAATMTNATTTTTTQSAARPPVSTSANNKALGALLLYIILPSVILLVIIGICIACIVKRKRRRVAAPTTAAAVQENTPLPTDNINNNINNNNNSPRNDYDRVPAVVVSQQTPYDATALASSNDYDRINSNPRASANYGMGEIAL
jgi:hypothetical protein